MEYVQKFDHLEADRAVSNVPYFNLLDVDSMHSGIYSLPAGGIDRQQPHTQDDVYFVKSGEGQIRILHHDYHVEPGSIVFVPAFAPHRFHSITKDLKTLVFLSNVTVAKSTAKEDHPT